MATTTAEQPQTPLSLFQLLFGQNPNSPFSLSITEPNRLVFIDSTNQAMVIVTPYFGSDTKEGPTPATKESIEGLARLKVMEDGGECPICLVEYEVGEKIKEMPCRHKYHCDCIEKWLCVNGSCPVCRHKMPVDHTENEKKNNIGSGIVEVMVILRRGEEEAEERRSRSVEGDGDTVMVPEPDID